MKKEYQNKQMTSDKKEYKSKQSYFFPKQGVTIKAESIEEATKLLSNKKKHE